MQPKKIAPCDRCGIDMDVRLTSQKEQTWSWQDRKWLDLCRSCRQWLFHYEWSRGIHPKSPYHTA